MTADIISTLRAKGWREQPDGSWVAPGRSDSVGREASEPKKHLGPGFDSESEFHQSILKYCALRGLLAIHSRMDIRSTIAIGAPDFVIAMPNGKTVWIEAKAPKGKVSPMQEHWMRRLKELGHMACVVRTWEDFLKAVESADLLSNY